MKISISKNQLNLLRKRNAASETAASAARTAQLVARQSEDNARQSAEAFSDVVSCISLDHNNAPEEYASITFGEDDDGACFLELVELPK